MSSSSINFGYAGMNIKKESSNNKITSNSDQSNIGVLKRNKLLLEHVVINRNKSLTTLIEE